MGFSFFGHFFMFGDFQEIMGFFNLIGFFGDFLSQTFSDNPMSFFFRGMGNPTKKPPLLMTDY